MSKCDQCVSPPAVCGARGVVLEALGRFEEAVRDYRSVLAVQPNDPAAWNNLGNATRGLGLWQVLPPPPPPPPLLCPGRGQHALVQAVDDFYL